MEGSADGRHDTLRERGRSHPRVFHLLVTSNRAVLAGLFLLFVPAALLLGGLLHPAPFEFALVERAPIQGLYQALVIATVTGATLVLTLSQLVLAEEFGPVGEQRARMEAAISFRREVEGMTADEMASARPSRVLKALLATILDRASAVQEAAGGLEDPDLAETIGHYVDHVRRGARMATSRLEPSSFGTFRTVKAVFGFDVSAVLHETGRLRSRAALQEADDLRTALDAIEEALEVFGSARAHLKAMYFQRELGDLSRWIIYTSFPAIVVAVASLLFFDPTAMDSGWTALAVASVTISVALTPFAILLAYVLRIVKVSQVTFSHSPFLVREA